MRPYQRYFALGATSQKEHLISDMAVALCRQLEARIVDCVDDQKPTDLADWIQYGMDGQAMSTTASSPIPLQTTC